MLVIFLASCLSCDLHRLSILSFFPPLYKYFTVLFFIPRAETFLAVLCKCKLDLSLPCEIMGGFWKHAILIKFLKEENNKTLGFTLIVDAILPK